MVAVAPAFARGRAGDVVTLRVQRPGVAEPFDVPVVLEASPASANCIHGAMAGDRRDRLLPRAFLVVGLLVLFLRIDDRNAWLLALMFAGFIAAAPVAFLEGVLSPRADGVSCSAT